MRPPAFWQHGDTSVAARVLAPLATVYAAATARRVARPGWRAPVPVICCGNAVAGGSGKTTLALELGRRLLARGRDVAFLTRGYGGRMGATTRVDPDRHDVGAVGDEALLLAGVAPTYVAADRAEGARAAVADGAGVLVMDDGLQNPGLMKDLSFLVIDGWAGFGNGRVIPAGPLREPVSAAAARCTAAVLIGADRTGAATACLPPDLPVLHAALVPDPATRALAGRRVFAFAGIGRPGKFFATLRDAGAVIAGTRGFADHHRFTGAELHAVLDEANRLGAVAVTTPKDATRLPVVMRERVHVAGVDLEWTQPDRLDALLASLKVVTR